MKVCEFCVKFQEDGTCYLQLPLPKTMTCREFSPALRKFCADRKDFVDPRQIMEMATFFGIKGPELRKVKAMAASEQNSPHAP